MTWNMITVGRALILCRWPRTTSSLQRAADLADLLQPNDPEYLLGAVAESSAVGEEGFWSFGPLTFNLLSLNVIGLNDH